MKRKTTRGAKARAGGPWGPRLAGAVGLLCLVWAGWGLVGGGPGGDPETGEAAYYPMEVGRYWVYRHTDPGSGANGRVERRIERRERREGRELFFYGDGDVVYRSDGKVFEMGAGGGVNVIPVGGQAGPLPYVYRSEGLRIEKSLGAVDTSVVVDGRRFDGCIEVLTRYRADDGGQTATYASYYARGIGLVGRRPWPGDGAFSLALRQYGVKKL